MTILKRLPSDSPEHCDLVDGLNSSKTVAKSVISKATSGFALLASPDEITNLQGAIRRPLFVLNIATIGSFILCVGIVMITVMWRHYSYDSALQQLKELSDD